MKNIKAVTLIILAVIVALGAATYASGWLAQRSKIASRKVVVAAVDIELGSRINPQMVSVVDWPSSSVPEGAFSDIGPLQERVVKVSVSRGDAILERKLSPPGSKGGLSSVIAEGKRAMTVRVNDVIGVAGFALPGTYVDVMVNAQQDRARGEGPNQVSMTVLEHVLVLAVAQEAGRDETKPKVVSAVTLELSPADAEKLDLARSVGTLSLVLRNQFDKDRVVTTGITREELLRLKAVVATKQTIAPTKVAVQRRHPTPAVIKAVAPAPTECVDILRSGVRATHCF
jgi:pilus assembly protein CpaB